MPEDDALLLLGEDGQNFIQGQMALAKSFKILDVNLNLVIIKVTVILKNLLPGDRTYKLAPKPKDVLLS